MSVNISCEFSCYTNRNLTTLEWNTTTLESGELWKSVIIGLLLCVLIFMTICGNVLVIIAISINRHLRITTNYFILNLAIADLLLGTTVLPFSASLEVVDYWAFGETLCDIWAACDVLCCTASIMSLCVISIDRYIGVTRPLQHSSIVTESRAIVIIVVVWLLATAISVAPLAGWKEPPPEDDTICEVTKQLGYVLFSVSGSFYIPLIIILVVYYRVYKEATKQSRFLATGIKRTHAKSGITLRIHYGRPSNHGVDRQLGQAPYSPQCRPGAQGPYRPSIQGENRQLGDGAAACRAGTQAQAGRIAKFKREKKAAKTLGIVVGVFILCWFPFFFILPFEAFCPQCEIPGWLFKIIFWLGYCNSTMNPIIYACSSREFKRAFIRILNCTCRRRFPSYITNTSKGYQRESRLTKMASAVQRWRHGNRATTQKRHSLPTNGDAPPNCMTKMLENNVTSNGPSTYDYLDLNQPIKRKDTIDSMVISEDESAIQEFSSDEGETDQSHKRHHSNLESILEEMRKTQRTRLGTLPMRQHSNPAYMNTVPPHSNAMRAHSMNPITDTRHELKLNTCLHKHGNSGLSISDTALCRANKESMLADKNEVFLLQKAQKYHQSIDGMENPAHVLELGNVGADSQCIYCVNTRRQNDSDRSVPEATRSNSDECCVLVSRSFNDTPPNYCKCSVKNQCKHCCGLNTAQSESTLQTPASVKRKHYHNHKHFDRIRPQSTGSQDYFAGRTYVENMDVETVPAECSRRMVVASTYCMQTIPAIVIEPACIYDTVTNV